MKKNLLVSLSSLFLCVLLFSPAMTYAQPLTGIKTIPGDYATIEAAITDLNLNGVGSGGVTFNVAAGHSETFTSDTSGRFRATGSASDPIVFQKSGGGANPVITAGVGTGTLDGIIIFTGGDYITFDGIDLQENSGNLDAISQMEWGYALLKRNLSFPADGCQYVTIKNSTITLDNTNTSTWGIYAKNHTVTSTTSSTLSDSLDIMRYCKFYSNTITNSYNGIQLYGASSLYDENNEIGVDGGNSIINYGGGSTTARGVYTYYQSNLKIANNIVNGGNFSHTTLLYGISTYTANNADINIYQNSITLTQSNNLTYALTNSVGSLGVDNTVNIYDNTIQNCNNSASGSYSAWLIYNLASAYNVNIYGNTITNNIRGAGTGPMYCIKQSSSATNVQIYDNEIYNNTANGSIYGVELASGTNLSVYKNRIYDLRTTSTSSYLASGVVVSGSSSGPVNTNIYNNFISDLKASNSSEDDAIRGINLVSTTSGSNIGVYYNTIFLNAVSGGANFGTSGIYQTASTLFARPTLDMRDNIILNMSTPNGAGKTVVFRRSASDPSLNYYSSLSNNNCFYAGTPSASRVIFFDGTNFDQTLEDFKLRAAPRETNSITENVPFVNSTTPPYDLHVQTTVPTQTNNSGTPIATPIAITSDFDGDTRNVATPDIGADEFNGISIDITPPSIIYTAFDPTTSTANRTLSNVTITDQSGVNVTTGTAPRIYYRRSTDNNTYIDNTSTSNGWKYTETSNISSPFEFLIDYTLLFGGTGVQMGDVIEYFVVAQDLFTTPNVGINLGDFNTPPSSVNLTSAAFPITGSINSYYIISLLNGTVTVGTGGDYPSLTGPDGLFNAFNGNFVTGNVTAEIISDITEAGDISLNQWVEQGAGNYTLTIQPNSAVLRTISGSYAGGLFSLNGADRVTFDGRFNGSGNYLTFENTNAASNTATIRLLSLGSGQGCTDVTIRNCNIKAGANNLTNVFGIFIGSSTGSISTGNAGGADFDNISILENNISKCREGIFARGTSSDQMNNLIVSGNVIGSTIANEYVTEYGMYLGYATAPQVTYNEIFNMFYDVSKWGIYFTSNTNNAVVSKNKIHSIKQPGTTGYNSVGIVFWSATGCFDNQIDNNMIYDLSTYGNSSIYLVGIRIAGGSNYKVYYNSVSITDTIGNPAAGLVSSCLFISTASSNMDVRNNIFFNTRTGNDPRNYAVYSPNTTTFTNINNNDYWTIGNVIGYFGAEIANFVAWQTVTGQDANSYSVDPLFISNTDLHFANTGTPLLGKGIAIAGITTDFDGETRDSIPEIGADEFPGIIPVELVSFSASLDKNNVVLIWQTATELNSSYFNIERRSSKTEWNSIGRITAAGNSTRTNNYRFVDENVAGTISYYRLKQVDLDGSFTYSQEVEVKVEIPTTFSLSQNYPNPFNPITTIKFAIPISGNVMLSIFNSLGERTEILENGYLESGFHKVNWDASKYSSGVYYYRLESDNFSSVKKMILLK